MRMPRDFRYRSSWEKFEEAANYFFECLKENKAKLLYGCIKNIYVEIPNEKPEFKKIVMREVVSLLEEALEGDFDLQDLNDYLETQCEDGMIEEDDIQDILNMVEEKYKYVVERIVNNDTVRRYYFKENTINNKISGFQSDINKYIINNEEELKYALIRIAVNKKLPDFTLPNEVIKLIEDREEKVEFVCDVNDLDYLIEQLETIKKKLLSC